ncbi:hypothetical protein B0H17DRAFT_1199632 [Mycena rosella]|uniref:Uncharacterized protein n=1 Tax=Mycena rosella TaxID=1033263 RepID=A0AAD7DLB7_MYCRO|nr:hypothetical protein B0H17DRAFT_1199632 [Mycena rosella]
MAHLEKTADNAVDNLTVDTALQPSTMFPHRTMQLGCGLDDDSDDEGPPPLKTAANSDDKDYLPNPSPSHPITRLFKSTYSWNYDPEAELVRALRALPIVLAPGLGLSYDIVCQYKCTVPDAALKAQDDDQHVEALAAAANAHRQLEQARRAASHYHKNTQLRTCTICTSPIGLTDGEGPEHAWAAFTPDLNNFGGPGVAASVQEASLRPRSSLAGSSHTGSSRENAGSTSTSSTRRHVSMVLALEAPHARAPPAMVGVGGWVVFGSHV